LLLNCGGKSYDKGLYTIYTFEDSLKWTNLLSGYFKQYSGKFLAFGHDWMGRQFCVSKNVGECIYMFDAATQEDFYLPENLFQFHDEILSNSKIDNLASDEFEAILKHLGIAGLGYNKCLGFKVPLFLNGKAEVNNYEEVDLEVYWEMEHQLYQQADRLPDGTIVNKGHVI
jgi:hypothetical protein